MIFLARADYDGVYQHYRKWIESHPDDLAAVQRAVTFMLRQQAYVEAREILVSSLERAPLMTSLRLKLVDVLLAEDQTADALKQLKIASRQSPNDPDLIVQLGQLTWQVSEQDDAAREATVTIWRRLLSETNRGATADASRAFQFAGLLASVDYVDAAESYRRACELSPVAAYREQWGNYLFESGDQEQAIKVCERFKAAGCTQEQLSAIEMLADSDAENRERHLKQKTRLLLDLGRTDEAFRIVGRILDAAPNQKSASQFFAKICFECGKPDDGIAELRRLASRLYRDVDVVGGLAEALTENGRRSDAIEAYWRLFALQDSVAEKCDTVANLAKLHDSLERVDVLLRRFESLSPSSGSDDPAEHDEAVLFKAVVYEAAINDEQYAELQELL